MLNPYKVMLEGSACETCHYIDATVGKDKSTCQL